MLGRYGIKFAGVLAAVGQSAARLVFPPLCLACDGHVAMPGSLCPGCWPQIRSIEQPLCPVMGTPFTQEIGEGFLSAEAIASPPVFSRIRSAVIHTGLARRIVGDLKYRDRTDYAPWMARWMARAGTELIADADLIVPVPLHRRRFFQRRYNQSAELARSLARMSAKPFEPGLVQRVKPTRQQVGLERAQRQDNVRGAFKMTDAAKARVKGRRVMVVDDVYTTGATVSAVTRCLLRGGASAVDVLTFSRVLPGAFEPDALDDWQPEKLADAATSGKRRFSLYSR